MSITVNHQLELLMDLLDEHQSECCAQVSEYQQIKRLVKSMIASNTVTDEQLLQLLPEIYNYGRQGENAQNHEEHILTNQDNITNWISAIEQSSLQ